MRKFVILIFLASCGTIERNTWTTDHASTWYAQQPWLVGANYVPYDAINQLEMWQADTFNPELIDKELTWAEGLGMNTMRVFLHDLLWKDEEGFKKRLDQFLAICEKHHIHPMLVLFDSVWDPEPKSGTQHDPVPGVHNSGWVQSPGLPALEDETDYARLETYVKGVIGAFASDPRVLCWDLWNEPDNLNGGSYDDPKEKLQYVEKLLPKVFEWAREERPVQPLTSGVWKINYSEFKELTPIEKIQIDESDIITFHSYDDSTGFSRAVQFLQQYKRPMICTEYLARSRNSTFEKILPIGKQNNIGMINWGFVAGKTQTNLPWDSWQNPYVDGREPAVWHHEIFYPDGTPYSQGEVDFIRQITK